MKKRQLKKELPREIRMYLGEMSLQDRVCSTEKVNEKTYYVYLKYGTKLVFQLTTDNKWVQSS